MERRRTLAFFLGVLLPLPSASFFCTKTPALPPLLRSCCCVSPQTSLATARIRREQLVMTSAYGGTPGFGTKGLENVKCLPILAKLSTGRRVEVAPMAEKEWPEMMALMNQIIDEGRAWPFDVKYETLEGYRGYFLSHAAFVVRALEPGLDADGRCSHVCNGGFITKSNFRKQGAGRLMGACFLRLGRDLGYKLSYFNLVFESNPESYRLWDGLGFTRVAELPGAANLKGISYPVTAFGYYFDLTTLDKDFDAVAYAAQPPANRQLKQLWRSYKSAAPMLLPVALLALLFAVIKKQ